jgi:hypothetical protein
MDSKALKIGVISGIISSLVVIIFINPILSFVWKVTVAVAGSFHQGYIDRIYKNAAITDPNEIGWMTFLSVLSFGLIFAQFIFFYSIDWDFSRPWMTRIIRLLRGLCWFSIGILLLVMMVRSSIFQGTMYITASFTQRLTVLAPQIDDAEFKTFRAQWASMQSKADYDAIVAGMDKRAKELGVSLPPVRNP